ncbi:MAG TPA: NAD(P)H-dependent oxidoreductase [Acidimicrobiales bacterium]
MSKLQIIIASTRPGRAADQIATWVIDRARSHGGFDVEVLDLRDWPLPMFAEDPGTMGDLNDPTYSTPIVGKWNRKIKEADAYLVITPEYNHSVPGVLKNAIDSVFLSFAFRNKPVVAVGYSVGIGGGIRAIEHLAQIAVEAEMVPLRNAVVIPEVARAFDSHGEPVNPITETALGVALDDLKWWSGALEAARGKGQLPHAVFRISAAAAAVDEVEDEAV